jgi:hypothetical protein
MVTLDKFERILRAAVRYYPRHSPGNTEEIHEKLSQDSRCRGPELNWASPEYSYKSEATARPKLLNTFH